MKILRKSSERGLVEIYWQVWAIHFTKAWGNICHKYAMKGGTCLKPKVEDGNEGKAVQHHKRTNYQKALHIFSPLYSYAVNSSSFSTVSLQNVYEKTMGPAYVHASGLQSQLSKWHPFTDSSEGVRRTARAKWVCALTRLKTTGGLVHKKLSVRFFLH